MKIVTWLVLICLGTGFNSESSVARPIHAQSNLTHPAPSLRFVVVPSIGMPDLGTQTKAAIGSASLVNYDPSLGLVLLGSGFILMRRNRSLL